MSILQQLTLEYFTFSSVSYKGHLRRQWRTANAAKGYMFFLPTCKHITNCWIKQSDQVTRKRDHNAFPLSNVSGPHFQLANCGLNEACSEHSVTASVHNSYKIHQWFNNREMSRFLATANSQNQLTILDTTNYNVVSSLPTFENSIRLMEFATWDDNLLAVVSANRVHIWDTAGGAERGLFNHMANVYAIAFGRRHDGTIFDEFLITQCSQKLIRKWSLITNELMLSFSVLSFTNGLCVCHYGQFIVAALKLSEAAPRKICVWCSDTVISNSELEGSIGKVLADANLDCRTIRTVGCPGNDTILSMVANGRTAIILKLQSEHHVSLSTWVPPEPLTNMTGYHIFSGDGTKLLCFDFWRNLLYVLDSETLTLVRQQYFPFAPDGWNSNYSGNHICYCANEVLSDEDDIEIGVITQWNVFEVETGRILHTFPDVTEAVYSNSANIILM